jgi:hypothetical protein
MRFSDTITCSLVTTPWCSQFARCWLEMRKPWQVVTAAALALCIAGPSHPVQAEDFFFNLFGGFGARPPEPPRPVMPFSHDGPPPVEAPRAHRSYGSHTAWCVRTCDGRYFPITGNDAQSRASSCDSLCPASKTELVYGNDIDHASTANGKAYSELPNAFKYRNELVAGCTCNGKDPAGLASVPVEKDPTLRKGDIVAGADGLMVAHPGSGKHAELNFTPAPRSVRMRFQRAPVMARE